MKAAEQWRLTANDEARRLGSVTFAAVLERYVREQMPDRITTRTHYMPRIKNHIEPRWGSYLLTEVKPFLVQEWLRFLPLSKKSKQHIRSLMRQVFVWAMMWELLDLRENPMSLVRIKAGSDEEPAVKRVLTAEEFQLLLPLIPVPFRTMVVIAACLGLRVSEILWPAVGRHRLGTARDKNPTGGCSGDGREGENGEIEKRHASRSGPSCTVARLQTHYRTECLPG
jgi:integrase